MRLNLNQVSIPQQALTTPKSFTLQLDCAIITLMEPLSRQQILCNYLAFRMRPPQQAQE